MDEMLKIQVGCETSVAMPLNILIGTRSRLEPLAAASDQRKPQDSERVEARCPQ